MKDPKLDQELKELWGGSKPEIFETLRHEGEVIAPASLKRRIVGDPANLSERTSERRLQPIFFARLVPAAALAGVLALAIVISRGSGPGEAGRTEISDQELEEIVMVLVDAESAADDFGDGQFDFDVEDV